MSLAPASSDPRGALEQLVDSLDASDAQQIDSVVHVPATLNPRGDVEQIVVEDSVSVSRHGEAEQFTVNSSIVQIDSSV